MEQITKTERQDTWEEGYDETEHEYRMRTDFTFWCSNNTQLDAVQVLLTEIDEEEHHDILKVLEYLADGYKLQKEKGMLKNLHIRFTEEENTEANLREVIELLGDWDEGQYINLSRNNRSLNLYYGESGRYLSKDSNADYTEMTYHDCIRKYKTCDNKDLMDRPANKKRKQQ